jgi:SAM-dependent methyltransferase
MVAKKIILKLFQPANLLTRLYIRVKLCICPLRQVETYFPEKGKIIDLGCGNGLFAGILKLGSPERTLLGYDLDEKKLAVARHVPGRDSGLDFFPGDIARIDFPAADVFSLIDVLYLIPFEKQDRVIRKCSDSLSPRGLLFIKEMDKRPRW